MPEAVTGSAGDKSGPGPRPEPGRDQRPWRAILVLGLTQVIGWGTTYSLPAVLVDPISADLGLSPAFVFAGISVMLLVNAAAAPLIGPSLDRLGAARVLVAGSLVTAVGLAVLAMSRGPVTYLIAWTVLGLAMATALSTPAYAALVAISGRGARADIATLTLFTGFSSFLFWPLTLSLLGYLDWRGIVLCYALVHVVVCAPLHWLALPRPASGLVEGRNGAAAAGRAGLNASNEWRGFWLVAVAFSAAGFVGWGLALQLPRLFADLGLAPMTAITIAGLAGPVQVAARAIDMVFAGRTRAITVASGAVALLAASLVVLALTILLAQGGGTAMLVGTLAFIALWGTANGLITVARAAVPLEVFEPARFGTWMGRLALYQNIAFAVAPVVLAATIERFGVLPALALTGVFAVAALAAMIALGKLLTGAAPDNRQGGP